MQKHNAGPFGDGGQETWMSMVLNMDAGEGQEDVIWHCASTGRPGSEDNHRVFCDGMIKLKGVILALANLSLRITGNELDTIELSDPRTGLPVLAGVHLLPDPGTSGEGIDTVSLTPPPLKMQAAEGGAVAGGALKGRMVVVAASDVSVHTVERITGNLARLVQLVGEELSADTRASPSPGKGAQTGARDGAAGSPSVRGGGARGVAVGVCCGVLQDFLEGAGVPLHAGEVLSTYLAEAFAGWTGKDEELGRCWVTRGAWGAREEASMRDPSSMFSHASPGNARYR
jgi:hypothetical protein